MSLRAEVVVASNRAAAGVYADETGPLIVEFLQRAGLRGRRARRRARRRPGRRRDRAPPSTGGARLVLTTGGTGLTPTDRTPEVTRPLLDREVPGIAEAIRAAGVAKGVPTAALSRGLAGVVGELPGGEPARLARRREGRARGARADPRARRRAGRRERPLNVGWPADG